MKSISFISCFFIFSFSSNAQNLIRNPSFEAYSECPSATEQFVGYVDNWYSYIATPDYNNLCGYAPYANQENFFPRTGQGNSGLLYYNFNGPNVAREYMQGEIITPLIAGQSYYFEYYVHPTFPSIATNRQGAHFTTELITETPDPTSPNLAEFYLDLEPHIQNLDYVYTDFEWTKVSGCYIASGGEQYVMLGNFASNQDTDTTYLISWAQLNYNLIDDVSLYSLPSLVPNDTSFLLTNSLLLPDYVNQSYFYEGVELTSSYFIPMEVGNYELEVYLEDCGFIGSFNVEVFGCDDLSATYSEFSADTLVCVEDNIEISLANTQNLTFYLEQNLYSEDFFSVPDSGTYYLEIGIENCPIIDTFQITGEYCDVIILPQEGNDCFYIPSAFSPNDDGQNDTFKIYGECPVVDFELAIYDRWGNYIFQTEEIEEAWSGNWRDEAMDVGVYVYTLRIEYLDEEGQPFLFSTSGDLTLVR